MSPPPTRRRSRPTVRPALTDVLAAVAHWFADQLQRPRRCRGARLPSAQRGIDAASIPTVRDRLRARQPGPQGRAGQASARTNWSKAGCSFVPRKRARPSYDRFRGRLMIPIRDPRGRVIALRWPDHRARRAQVSQQARKPRSLTRAARSTTSTWPPPASRKTRAGSWWSRATWTSSPSTAPASARRSRPTAPRMTEAPARAAVAARSSSRSSASTVISAGQKAAIRAGASAPCPTSRPERTLRFVELPQGQDPDDLIPRRFLAALADRRTSGLNRWRWSTGCGVTRPRPSRWRRPRPAPASRPRLLAHAQAIGDPTVRQPLPRRIPAPLLTSSAAPPALPPAPAAHSARGTLQERPLRAARAAGRRRDARAIATAGIDAPTARALILGFANFPEELPAHCEQLAALPIADHAHRADCATSWSTPPSPAPRLIERALPPY